MKEKLARVETLDTTSERLVIVGDIHGCLDQLQELLREVAFNEGRDQLVSVGDLVNKGPDSFGVVRLLQRLGTRCVLGNHDVKLLKLARKLRKEGVLQAKNRRSSLAPLAETIAGDVELYLSQQPHILRIPAHNIIVVHAGLHPHLPLEQQHVADVTTMRNLVQQRDGSLVAVEETDSGAAWASLWSGPETVVFGHDARRGVQQHRYAIGLDSRCVYGGRLTAAVFPGGRLASVPGWSASSKV